MKKKYFVFPIVVVLIAVISFGLGYFYAFINGLTKANDMVVATRSLILLKTSATLIERLKSPDMAELLTITEENCESSAGLVTVSKPLIKDPVTRQ